MHKLLPIFALLTVGWPAAAYDLRAPNADGVDIYYNIIGATTLEVTAAMPFSATPDYGGVLQVPAQVTTADGETYTVTGIGERAFAFCDELTQLILPSTIDAIGSNAFDGCYLLTDLRFDGSGNCSTDGSAIYALTALMAYTPGTEGAYTVAEGTTEIAPSAFAACTFLTDIALPETLNTIGDNAFYFCNYLSGVRIPASVGHIGNSAFGDCLSLEYIDVDADNQTYSSIDGVLHTASGTKLMQSPGAKCGLAPIPDGVTSIGDEAFFRSYGITTVKMPPTVTEIGQGAFIDCQRLASVEIPASVRDIGALAFAMCPDLRSVYVNAVDPIDIKLGEGVFEEIDRERCTLFVPSGSVELYSVAEQWRDFGDILATDGLKPQTIEWAAVPDTVPIGSTVKLAAHASSTLPVDYVLSPGSQHYATLIDDVVHVHHPGEITVTAYQSGNVEYAPAVPTSCTLNATLTGIDDAIASTVKVYGTRSAIVIKGASPQATARVYDINGRLIYRGTDRRIPVQPHTIYIVHIDAQAHKVITR